MAETAKTAVLLASGDLRESANVECWPAQAEMERRLAEVFARFGWQLERGHPVDPSKGHGFISSQREGMDVLAIIDPAAPVVVAEAVWQYSHHVLPGLTTHTGPILTVANWSGRWPGLVGMLNLNGSLAKAGIPYSTLWSETFDDDYFLDRLQDWLEAGHCSHDNSHLSDWDDADLPHDLDQLAEDIVSDMRRRKIILGVFDEGCMGMYNAIIPDELLIPLGVFKERLSQSALFAEALTISDSIAETTLRWIEDRGLRFHFGKDPETDLTYAQVLDQCRMYHAAARLADKFGCEAIGIQYQQGLKDLMPASDLAEGMLNNDDRPEVKRDDGTRIRPGEAIVHFNEVDECAGLDAVILTRVHRALEQPAETTLHDLRWGGTCEVDGVEQFVWLLEISGAAPPAHHEGGWGGSESFRQPPMYFPLGGGTLAGVARPGEIVWSRIFVESGRLNMHVGRGRAVRLDDAESRRRRQQTTPQWPVMHAVLNGVTRDQMMGHHRANHIQVAYANSAYAADRTLQTRAAVARKLGMAVKIAG